MNNPLKPNKNAKVPEYDLLTEGFDPNKLATYKRDDSVWSKETQESINKLNQRGKKLIETCDAASEYMIPEYRLVTVDGFDLRLRQIIIKYDKFEPMPMVSVGETLLVARKPNIEEMSTTPTLKG